jgi:His-Xaa-Ser system protein HxsD
MALSSLNTRRMLHMLHMRLILPMPPVAESPTASPIRSIVDFDSDLQSLGALEAAAYRMIGTATCRIELSGNRYVCCLTAKSGSAMSAESLAERFVNFVTDENLRTRIADKTANLRNVILALAFGALAAD